MDEMENEFPMIFDYIAFACDKLRFMYFICFLPMNI